MQVWERTPSELQVQCSVSESPEANACGTECVSTSQPERLTSLWCDDEEENSPRPPSRRRRKRGPLSPRPEASASTTDTSSVGMTVPIVRTSSYRSSGTVAPSVGTAQMMRRFPSFGKQLVSGKKRSTTPPESAQSQSRPGTSSTPNMAMSLTSKIPVEHQNPRVRLEDFRKAWANLIYGTTRPSPRFWKVRLHQAHPPPR